MGAVAVARLVSAGLNPVLTPAGFAEGQWGADDRNERGQIIYCAGHDEFSDRYPWAPQANDHERGLGACIDLIIEVSGMGTVEFVDLEALSLEETLRRVGYAEEASRSAELMGRPLAEALPALAAILQRMFEVRQ